MTQASFFCRIGGAAAVDAAVDIFYRKVLFVRSMRRERYLAGTPLERIPADPFVPPASSR